MRKFRIYDTQFNDYTDTFIYCDLNKSYRFFIDSRGDLWTAEWVAEAETSKLKRADSKFEIRYEN